MPLQIRNTAAAVLPVISTRTELSAIRFVREMGIRPNLAGYQYLITAICLSIKYPYLLVSLTHELYPAIAQYHNVTASAIERNIRTAIELAYVNNPTKLQSIFCYRTGKPYISEVIATAVETIQFGL